MEINLPQNEEKILTFWKRNKIFEKSLKKTKKGPKFIFYEGPPFANGLPGIHHLLSRAFKDIVLRYKTMQGFFVERKAGWDTHGLPTEMEAEKKLGIKNKKEIEKNIEKFIKECRNNVFTYKKEWEKFTQRIGYWLDLENAYITCSNEYIESLWWILKKIWDKDFLYQDYKVVPYCPRCGTSLSSHEVAQGYKKIKENSIYVKFSARGEKNTYFLVWTTTPWTLPGNVAIAVNPKIKYVKIKKENEYYYIAEEKISWFGDLEKKTEIINTVYGKELIGKEYNPLFNFIKPDKKSYYIISGDFVSTEEGTGLVHIAPAFGEEDMEVGKKNDLPVLTTVNEEGNFKKEIKFWAGMYVKKADPLIVDNLKKRGILFKEEFYEHDYPFCWRCDSPLLYYAKKSWFIKMTAVKEDLIKNNQRINWVPSYLKNGRFGEWLKEVKDWNLSRERYWGTPLPIWECGKCKKRICIGSIKELKEKAKISSDIKDLHRPYIDKITMNCQCGGLMKRTLEVIDCWFDSGSMPFGQWHYPFENRNKIDKGDFFPADFICEGVDQTRGWFYTLLVISTLLGLGISYKNVISQGIVLDERGRKMSKSKGNVVKPSDVTEKYGADVARFYFYTINPVGEPKRFDFKDIQTLYRRFFDTLYNIKIFFITYSDKKIKPKGIIKPKNILDKWIISYLEELNFKVIEKLEIYDVVGAARLFEEFIDNFSNFYIRLSRKRFQKPRIKKEKEEALQILHYTLFKLSGLLAPFAPFISEIIYKDLKGKEESVHLTDYPEPQKKLIDGKLKKEIEWAKNIITSALAERVKSSIKTRQPLFKLEIKDKEKNKELTNLIKDEVNVKNIIFNEKMKAKIKLDTKITPKLREEGIIREAIRNIQEMRKKAKLKPKDNISVRCLGTGELNNIINRNKKFILKEAKIKKLNIGDKPKQIFNIEREIKVEHQKLWLAIRKI